MIKQRPCQTVKIRFVYVGMRCHSIKAVYLKQVGFESCAGPFTCEQRGDVSQVSLWVSFLNLHGEIT